MRWLQDKRIELNVAQAELARRCGMTRQRLSLIESGRALPTRAQAKLLAQHLGLGGVPCVEELVPVQRIDLSVRGKRYAFEPVNQERWESAVRFWGQRFRGWKLAPDTLAWMRNLLRCDSAIEALAWILLAVAGAAPFLGNPHQWGFRQHPIVDGLGVCLGERVLPGLSFELGDVAFWIWPQVNLRPKDVAFRVDALVLVREGDRYRWLVLELDGDGHVSQNDRFRREQLKMAEVRIGGNDIKAFRLVELLLENTRLAA